MTDVLLTAVLLGSILLVSILTLAGTILSLRSSRRSEVLGEDRYELLRDQRDRLELLREERRMLIEELERQSREHQQLMEFLGKIPSQLVEDLKKERREHLEAQERIEDLKQERLRLEQERARLEGEVRSLRAELDSQRRAPTRDPIRESEASHPWLRRPVLLIGLFFGALVAWFTSLVVALYLMSP